MSSRVRAGRLGTPGEKPAPKAETKAEKRFTMRDLLSGRRDRASEETIELVRRSSSARRSS